jgi:DNA polymerase
MAEVNDPRVAENPGMVATFDDLKILHDVCVTCVRCDLSKTRTQVVFGDGPYLPAGEIGIMIVGEAPGEDEDKQGKPFVGRSGRLLDSMLKEAGLDRSTLWVSNTNKCRPVLIESGKYKNRAPTTAEQKACEIWWQNEMRLLKPQIVLCLGATAAKKLLERKDFQITKERGQWLPGPLNTELLVTFHPSYVLRMQGPALTEVKKTVVEDLGRVKTRLEALRTGKAEPQSWQKTAAPDDGQLSMF